MSEFVHLHLHSQYSLLDGAIHLKKLFPTIQKRDMDAVAITDHGFMYGTLDFYLKAKAAGVKPIIGCETYITSDTMEVKTNRDHNYHLILLARNETGLKNLQYMVSMAAVKGFYYNPRIDHALLREHSAGLVGCSACLGGEIPRTYFASGYQAAKELALKYRDTFEEGWFFLELQDNGLEDQNALNHALVQMSQETGIPLVATNDCHYLDKEDARAQEVLMAISQGKRLTDENRMAHTVDAFYIKTPEEMMRSFASVPQAIENTVRIAEACNVDIPNNVSRGKIGEKPVYFLPQYDTPEGATQEDHLRTSSADGLRRRFGELEKMGQGVTDEAPYFERMDHELNVITRMGFSGYFLIVSDFIRWAKEHGIPVGPGRGSGAGSIVAYAMGITELDPIRYGLLFERFLNPERISMPDFDIDFCKNRREEVLAYVRDKYGEEKVAQIATFSTLKSRAVVRDVGRVLGVDLKTVDKVAKLIPMNSSLEQGMEEEPRLPEMAREDPVIAELLGTAKKLEGMYRHPGVHAAGVVISDKPVWEVVPATKGRTDAKGESAMEIPLVTQYDKNIVEEAGLVKFDFLGLDNLTKIQDAVKRINRERKREGQEPFDINLIPLDEPEVFKMISRGETGGVFQMESEGFGRLLHGLKPDRFEDMIAAVALYRPGPLQGGMVDDFVKRKHGFKEIAYLHPLLEGVLEETYGVFVYQEQVMMAARVLAGFSMGKADEMRKAMGKKLMDKMAALKVQFTEGCVRNDIEQGTAEGIFDLMLQFAEYGFNKSHSAAYALISYQTAYLRHFYPIEFMAGILSCERSKPDKVMKYLQVARQMGIKVLPPDINESFEDFTIVKNKDGQKVIRFGLGAIKGVGDSAVEAILEFRGDAPYESVFDLCRRVDLRRMNKGVLEALIGSGALDALWDAPPEAARARLFAGAELAVKAGSSFQKEKASNQTSLFDLMDESALETQDPELPEVEPWLKQSMFKREKEVLGIYISGHPLENYVGVSKVKDWTHTIGELQEYQPPRPVELDGRAYIKDLVTIGIVSAMTERRTREKKERYVQGEIDGMDGQLPFFVGSKVIDEADEALHSNEPLLFFGALEISNRDGVESRTFRVSKLERVSESRLKGVSCIKIKVDLQYSPELLRRERWTDSIAQIVDENPGPIMLAFHIDEGTTWETLVGIKDTVDMSDKVIGYLEQQFGEKNLVYLKERPRSWK